MNTILKAVFFGVTMFTFTSWASGPKGVQISGRILDVNSELPLEAVSVDFTVKVLSPDNCLLYQEEHLGKDLSATDGGFSLTVGTGTSAVNVYATAGQEQSRENILKIFSNDTPVANGLVSQHQGSESAVCSGTYTPVAGDARKVKIVFNTGTGGPRAILPYHHIGTVPYAMVAQEAARARDADKLGGVPAASYAQTADLATAVPSNETDPTVQAFAKAALPNCTAGQVLKSNGSTFSCVADTGGVVPVATTSSTGIIQAGTGLAVDGSGVLSVGSLPISQIAGLQTALDDRLQLSTYPLCSDSQVARWDSLTDTFVCTNISLTASRVSDFNTAVDARLTAADSANPKLALSGGTMAGDLNMGGEDLLSVGHITMGAAKTLLLGNFTQVQEDALVLNAGHKGLSWYNSDLKALRYYDGAAKLTVAASTSACTDGQILKWNDTAKTWDCSADVSGGAAPGDATYAAKGLVQFNSNANTSGISLAAGVATVNTGTSAHQIIKLDVDAKLPAVDGSALTNLNASNLATGTVPAALLPTATVAKGGTGLTAGTSGGIPYFNSGTTMASSAALTQHGVVLGGGAGAAPVATSAGTGNQILRVPAGGGAPTFGSIDLSSADVVGTSVLPIANGGTGAANAVNARTALGLGTAAVATTGSAAGNVPVLGTGGLVGDRLCVADSAGTGIVCNTPFPTTGLVGALTMEGKADCVWSHSNQSYARYAQDTDCAAATLLGSALAPTEGKIPAIRFSNLPAGNYEVVVSLFAFYPLNSGVYCRYRIWDGTNFSGTTGVYEAEISSLTGLFSYSSNQASITFYVQAQSTVNGEPCYADISVPNQDKLQIWVKRL